MTRRQIGFQPVRIIQYSQQFPPRIILKLINSMGVLSLSIVVVVICFHLRREMVEVK